MARSDTSDLQHFVSRLTARSVLTTEEQQSILALPTRTAQVDANRDYIRLGEQVDHACLIVEGMMGRFGQNSKGDRQITAIHVPGDMADLHSVVRPVGTSALQALSTTTVLRVPHEALRGLARRHPAIAEAFWRDCMVDAAILSQWVVNVGRRDARTRLAHLLCEMAIRVGDEGEPKLEFSFPLTQTHLADAAGLTPVHVNRMLQTLRKDELVDIKGKRAHILDWKGLSKLGDFNSDYLQADVGAQDRQRLLH